MVERESKTQSDAIKFLKTKGCFVHKNPQNMYTRTGIPDLTVCIPITLKQLKQLYSDDDTIGIYAGIEMKRPKGGIVSKSQEIVGRQITKSGGVWFVANNVTTIEEFFERIRS